MLIFAIIYFSVSSLLITPENKLDLLMHNYPNIFVLSYNLSADGKQIPEVTLPGGSKFTCTDALRDGVTDRKIVVANKVLKFLWNKWNKCQPANTSPSSGSKSTNIPMMNNNDAKVDNNSNQLSTPISNGSDPKLQVELNKLFSSILKKPSCDNRPENKPEVPSNQNVNCLKSATNGCSIELRQKYQHNEEKIAKRIKLLNDYRFGKII